MNRATQRQALVAGGRTAIQAFQASLLVILGAGGLMASVTDVRTVQWVALGSALLAGLLTAFFAGLNSYLNFTINGVPATYNAQNTNPGPTPAPQDYAVDTTAVAPEATPTQ